MVSDVLYLRRRSQRHTPAVGEETDEGLILLRDQAADRPLDLTIVNWWKRFGAGELPDSLAQIQSRIQPWTQKLAA